MLRKEQEEEARLAEKLAEQKYQPAPKWTPFNVALICCSLPADVSLPADAQA